VVPKFLVPLQANTVLYFVCDGCRQAAAQCVQSPICGLLRPWSIRRWAHDASQQAVRDGHGGPPALTTLENKIVQQTPDLPTTNHNLYPGPTPTQRTPLMIFRWHVGPSTAVHCQAHESSRTRRTLSSRTRKGNGTRANKTEDSRENCILCNRHVGPSLGFLWMPHLPVK
jgi:hypothetical protein